MRQFKSILFVADGGEGEKSVFLRAAKRADTNGAKLTLFAALDAERYQIADQEALSAIEAINQTRLEGRREELEELRQEALSAHPDLKVEVVVETGAVAVSAIRAVIANHHDLVMKAAAGSTRKFKRLFGTVDRKLMRKCPCPLWIIKPSSDPSLHKIMAAVDLNPTDPDAELLAEKIMALGTALATDEGSELHVVHAWHLSTETVLRGRQIDTTDVDAIVRSIEAAHQSEVDRLLAAHPYTKTKAHLIKGEAEHVIPDLAEQLEVDLVIIGTVGRAGVPGLFIGNTAEAVLDAVDCSVLTLKPEGFETPIQV